MSRRPPAAPLAVIATLALGVTGACTPGDPEPGASGSSPAPPSASASSPPPSPTSAPPSPDVGEGTGPGAVEAPVETVTVAETTATGLAAPWGLAAGAR
jgi:hypothetical protein